MSPLPPFTSRPQRVLRWLWPLLGLALVVRHWIWAPTLIQGASMVPTLRGGQLAGINKLAYAFRRPARGDLVAVWTGKELMVKRVVGLPGEELCVDKGVLYVNGAPLPEPYVKLRNFWQNIAAGRIEADCFVVAGDNRAGSVIAVVSSKRIEGQIVCRGNGSIAPYTAPNGIKQAPPTPAVPCHGSRQRPSRKAPARFQTSRHRASAPLRLRQPPRRRDLCLGHLATTTTSVKLPLLLWTKHCPQVHRAIQANPKGIGSLSPGLRACELPWEGRVKLASTPTGLHLPALRADATPLGLTDLRHVHPG
jgi:signal peptidase I